MNRWSCISLQTVLRLAFAICLTGCGENTPLRDAVNKTFPPINHIDHQVTAVKASSAELAAFTSAPTIYAVLAATDLQKIVPESIASNIKAGSGKSVDISACDAKLALGNQEVVVTADFDLRVPAEQTSVAGAAEVHSSVSIERGALVFRPSGSTLRLSSLKYKGTKAPSVLVPLLNALLRTFLDNVNGAVSAQRVPIRVHVTKTIDLAETLRQTPGVVNSAGTTVVAGAAIGSSAVLVEPRAIRVLGSAVFLTPKGLISSFQLLEARIKAKRTDPLVSDELAALAACVDPAELAGALKGPDVMSVKKVCEDAEKGIALIKTEHFPSTSDAAKALAASYTAYSDGFMKQVQGIEPSKGMLADNTLIAFSRPAIAKGVQEVLAGASASATYVQSIPPKNFSQLITPTTTDLKCTENAGGCPSDFSYPGFSPAGCPSNCSGWSMRCAFGICTNVPSVDLGCQARKTTCEAGNAAAKPAYEMAKAAAQAAWSVGKATCELKKSTTKAGCQLNQGWLDTWSSQEIARIEGSAGVPDLKVFAAIDGVQLAPDFSALVVQYRLSADAHVSATAKLTPLNGGHLICAMPVNLSLNATGHVEGLTKSIAATEQPTRQEGDDLVLNYAISGQQVALTFSPALPVALFDQNTDKLLLSCPAPVAIVASIPGFSAVLVGLKVALRIRPDAFDSTKTIDIPGRIISFKIPSQTIVADSKSGTGALRLLLRPHWGKNALIFSASVTK
jgi:hypothetical protein